MISWIIEYYCGKILTLIMLQRLVIGDFNQHGSWCVIGDFNNVAKAHDRIGGKIVTEVEYVDMQNIMTNIGLCEMDSIGDYLHGLISMLWAPFILELTGF